MGTTRPILSRSVAAAARQRCSAPTVPRRRRLSDPAGFGLGARDITRDASHTNPIELHTAYRRYPFLARPLLAVLAPPAGAPEPRGARAGRAARGGAPGAVVLLRVCVARVRVSRYSKRCYVFTIPIVIRRVAR